MRVERMGSPSRALRSSRVVPPRIILGVSGADLRIIAAQPAPDADMQRIRIRETALCMASMPDGRLTGIGQRMAAGQYACAGVAEPGKNELIPTRRGRAKSSSTRAPGLLRRSWLCHCRAWMMMSGVPNPGLQATHELNPTHALGHGPAEAPSSALCLRLRKTGIVWATR